jgi:hypothetical protein
MRTGFIKQNLNFENHRSKRGDQKNLKARSGAYLWPRLTPIPSPRQLFREIVPLSINN